MMPPDKSPDTELNYERELLSSDLILVYGQETINKETYQGGSQELLLLSNTWLTERDK